MIWNAVTSLGIAGKTDAEIAAILSAVTIGPIAVKNLRFWLRQEGLASRNHEGVWSGALVELISAPGIPEELVEGISELLDHVGDDMMETIATHQPTWAIKAAGMLAALRVLGVITDQQKAAFYLQDTGLRFGAVTEQQVTEARAAKAAADNAVTLQGWFDANVHTPVYDAIAQGEVTTVAAVKAMLVEIGGG